MAAAHRRDGDGQRLLIAVLGKQDLRHLGPQLHRIDRRKAACAGNQAHRACRVAVARALGHLAVQHRIAGDAPVGGVGVFRHRIGKGLATEGGA